MNQISSQSTPDDMGSRRRVVFNILANWSYLAVHLLAGLVFVRIVTDGLGQRNYGVWGLIGGLLQYLTIGVVSISLAVPKFVAEYRAKNEVTLAYDVVNTAANLMLAITVIIAPVMALFAYYVLRRMNDIPAELTTPMVLSATIMGANLGLTYVARVYIGAIQGTQRYVLTSVIESCWRLLRIAIVILAFKLLYSGLEILAMGQLAATILFILMALITAKRVLPDFAIKIGFFSRQVLPRFGKFLAGMTILTLTNVLCEAAIPFIITAFFGLEAVASYIAARTLAYSVKPILPAMTRVLVPMSSALHATVEKRDTLGGLLIKASQYCVWFSGSLVVMLIAYGQNLLSLIMPKIAGAYPPLVVISLGSWATWGTSSAISILIGMGHIKAITWAQTVVSIVGLLLAIFAPLVFNCSMTVVLMVIFICLSVKDLFWLQIYAARKTKLSLKLFISHVFGKPIIATFILAAMAYILPKIIPMDSRIHLFFHLIVMFGIFVCISLAVVVAKNDRSTAIAFLRRKLAKLYNRSSM